MSIRRDRVEALVAASFALTLLFQGCVRRAPGGHDIPVVDLAVLDVIPHQETGDPAELIWGGVDIETGPDGRIYVADSKACLIHVFDAAGGHLGSFGRKGQGPGEFLFPHALAVTTQRIFVKDRFGTIKSFDAQWRYRSLLRLARSISGFATRDARTFYACPIMPVDPERREKALDEASVLVLDETGAVAGSFGSPVPLVKDMNILNMAHVALDADGDVYVAYEYFPLVRKYSASGRLVEENELPYDFIAEYRRENESTYGTSSYYMIAPDIKTAGGRVFVLCLDRSIVRFLEMGPDLDLRRIYRLDLAPLGDNVRGRSFALGSRDGGTVFYLLDDGDQDKVYVAGPR